MHESLTKRRPANVERERDEKESEFFSPILYTSFVGWMEISWSIESPQLTSSIQARENSTQQQSESRKVKVTRDICTLLPLPLLLSSQVARVVRALVHSNEK